MSFNIEARFAGGDISVDTGSLLDNERVVLLDMPGMSALPLFPHEARALAAALSDAADETEWEAS